MKKRNKLFIVSLMMSVSMPSLGDSSLFTSASLCSDNRPFTFWYWMYGAVTKEGIHADLVGMKNVGLGGCYLMPIRGVKDRSEYNGEAEQLSPGFWNMVDYAFQQADSLNLDMGIHVCDGFALAGGPWISPAESMQKIVWTDTLVSYKDLKGLKLRQPESNFGYYEDIECFALPCKSKSDNVFFTPFKTEGTIVRNENGIFRTSDPGYITLDMGRNVTVRSLQIVPSGNNIQCQRLKIEVSEDDKNYHFVKQLQPVRQGWQSSGPAFTYSLHATSGRYFRFSWTPDGSEPGAEDLDAAKWKPTLKLKEILLCAESKINQWEGKNGSSWRIAESTDSTDVMKDDCISLNDIYCLKLDNGKVIGPSTTMKNKTGYVRILRFGHTSTGQMNATAGGGKGLEVDKFNVDAVDKLLDNWYLKFLQRPHSSVVKYLHVDSWECGTQNWGRNFAEEFKLRRGYDIIPYLPVYAGIPLVSATKSEQVLKDIRQTVNDLVNDVFFERIEERGHIFNKKISHESIAPTFVSDGLDHFKYCDLPMGEFWLNSSTHDKPSDMLDAVSGAHLYGKNIIQAEGFTEVRGVWNETPAMIKPLLDRSFALGMNKLFFHVDTHNPWINRKPGMTLDGIGLFFQRDNTWYNEAGGFVDYVSSCQKYLQKGRPVVDIAVFTGEELPSRSITPDRLVTILPGIFGKQCVESEKLRLENDGQPMTESPVGVNHSAGILDLKDWVNCMNGYKYDSMNRDALLNEATVKDGNLIMPGGIKYRILVLPGKTKMNPSFSDYSKEVRDKIEECRKAGVVVIDAPYTDSDFTKYNLQPDVILPQNVAYAHRSTDSTDIYFIANQEDKARDITASFRDTRSNGRKECMLHLAPYESRFVIFDGNEVIFDRNEVVSDGKEIISNVKRDTIFSEKLKGDWKISFESNGEVVKTPTLFDWSAYSNPKIKYYSGSATYTTSFKKSDKKEGFLKLNLGEIKDIAHIYVNGIDCGTVWTAPYEVDITKAAKKKLNELKIVVVNTWANALRGYDKGLPPFDGIWTNAKYRIKGDSLLPAGLLGPVSLEYIK